MVAVKYVRIEVCAIWPGNRPDLRIGLNLGENLIIVGDFFERRAPEEGRQVDDAFGSVREPESHDPVMKNLYVGDVDQIHSYGNG
jgi:hypothetical protein